MRDLAALWLYLADTSCRSYSPLYDRICRAVAENDAVLDLVEEAPPRAHHPVLLLAVVHYLLLDGLDHPLAAVYDGRSDADPGPLFLDVCLQNRAAVLDLLTTKQVNTNEVGRSAVIAPALTTVANRLGAPLAQVDVGCSAGLNLLSDRYRLDYGPVGATGPVDAAVTVDCEVVGGSPPIAATLPAVAARVGLDRDPIDVHDDGLFTWQLACVWPDTGRLPRTRLALEEARRERLQLVKGDAVDDVAAVIAGLPAAATAVVTTTSVVAYFSLDERAAFRDALAAASTARPVAWISSDMQGVVDVIPSDGAPSDASGIEWNVLGLITFRDGEAAPELLGYAHPHGNGLDWRMA